MNDKQGYVDHIRFHTKGLKQFIHKLDDKNISYSQKYIADVTASSTTRIEISFKNESF